jgi:hypothetical protein
MHRKGQVEAVIILGIIVVVAVVIILAIQIPGPGPLTPQSRTVKDSIENFIRAGAYDTIKTMGIQGGYLTTPTDTVTFLGKEVPYWNKGGQLNIPDLSANLANGLKQYIIDNKDGLAGSFDKPVTLGSPTVTATILSSKVDLVVNLPTTVDGSAIAQPYSVSIPTKLGDINDFARSFATENNDKRFFEMHTIAFYGQIPPDPEAQPLPWYFQLRYCGEFFFKTWNDIRPNADEVVKRVVAQTYMPNKAPLNTLDTTGIRKYELPPINGKTFDDLDVTFFLPDDFGLTRNSFQFSPDPIQAVAEPIEMVGICLSDTVLVEYDIKYPVIVRVEDTLTNDAFQFALDVQIEANEPADWTSTIGDSPSICDQLDCSASILVKNSKGEPIKNTDVFFMGCTVGTTDNSGQYVGNIPCGIGPLNVYGNDYDTYDEMHSSDELIDISITLMKKPVVKLFFHEVTIQNLTTSKQYYVASDGIRWVDNDLHGDQAVMMTFAPPNKIENPKKRVFATKSGTISQIPEGIHYISGNLMTSDWSTVHGSMINQLILADDTSEMHVYLPYMVNFNAANSNPALDASRVLEICGIGPLSETEVTDFTGCTIGYGELWTTS